MRALAVLVLLAHVARADVPVEPSALPCRPTIACTADLVPPGYLELELGYIFRRLGNGAGENAVPFLLKLTLADWAQLQAGSNGPTFVSQPHASYFDDALVGIKLHLHDQNARTPAVSVSAIASVPTAAATGYLRTYDALFTLYVTKDFGWLHADWNLGWNEWRLDGSPIAQPWTALALSTSLGRGFGAMVEGYSFASAQPVSAADAGILSAISYQPSRWLVLDAGPDIGLESSRSYSLFVGATGLLARLW